MSKESPITRETLVAPVRARPSSAVSAVPSSLNGSGRAGDPTRQSSLALSVIRLARPEQWIKNVVVLLPLVFGGRMTSGAAWLAAVLGAVAFCLAASAVYATNDVIDRERDRSHPTKKNRPLAAGDVGVRVALVEAVLLLAASILVSLLVSTTVLSGIGAYVLLQACYCVWLKQKVIVDVMCIALGFVLRTATGALAIDVEVSPWLVICTFTMCLFMGFCKRRSEIAILSEAASPGEHRSTLDSYNPENLTHLTTLSAAVAVVSYFLYATSPRTVAHFGTWTLISSSPAVVYGVFRFALLSVQGRYAGPTELILQDRPFQAAAVLWLLSVCVSLLWLSWS
jgi:decaprenyl-phosphate phosphoribosyltransferase